MTADEETECGRFEDYLAAQANWAHDAARFPNAAAGYPGFKQPSVPMEWRFAMRWVAAKRNQRTWWGLGCLIAGILLLSAAVSLPDAWGALFVFLGMCALGAAAILFVLALQADYYVRRWRAAFALWAAVQAAQTAEKLRMDTVGDGIAEPDSGVRHRAE